MADTRDLSAAKRSLLEKYLRGQMPSAVERQPAIHPRATGDTAPLSYAQQQVWLHSQIAPREVPLYNETLTIHRHGALDVDLLVRTLDEIVCRHEIWRTTFDVIDGEPVQIIHPPDSSFDLPFIDLRTLPFAERDAQAVRLASEEASKPFDLAGPPRRALLIRLADDEYRLYLTFHQLIFDGVTAYQVFLPELAAIYEAFSQGQPSPLAAPKIQYADYALWQRQNSQDRSGQLEYWQRVLDGELSPLDWPLDRSRPPVQTHRGDIQTFTTPAATLELLRDLSRNEGASIFMILVAGIGALLHRYTGQDDIILGTPIAGRNLPDLQSMLGYFLNVLPLRLDISGDPTFRQLLARVKDAVIGALSNQDVPFTRLVETIRPAPDPSRNPFFQVAISLEPPIKLNHQGWTATQSDIPTGASKLDLYIDVDETPDGIRGPITYNPDLFDAATIARMMEHWRTLLVVAATTPQTRISELPILSAPERQQILVDWNDTAAEFPRDKCIHELIAEQAQGTPDALAAIFGDQALTYAELNRRSNQLARYLQKQHIRSSSLVGIYLERSLDMLVAVLGVLKAGAAYVPLDPAYPQERIAFIIKNAGIDLVLATESVSDSVPPAAMSVLLMDRESAAMEAEDSSDPEWKTSPGDLAYILYTSGSTGTPKGVAVEHRSVVNFLASMRQQPGFTSADVLLAVTTLSFDIAGLELYLPLLAGGRVVIATREQASDAASLTFLLQSHGITVMQATPATWHLLLESGWNGRPELKILCGGEALSRELAEQLIPRCRELWNMYGPTESTIWSTLYRVQNTSRSTTAIGKPIRNTQIYILDRSLQPVPAGIAGEIYVSGEGVARGYWKEPALTADRFIANPFTVQTSTRMYRTGDLARFLPDGNIEYLGRIDNQVKVRGFRVELGEIEAVLSQHSGVRQAVVAVRDELGDKSIVAYVVADQQQLPDVSQLRDFLTTKLPDYMLPARFVALPELPLTANGKVNRKALPEPSPFVNSTNRELPRDEVEAQLSQICEAVLGIHPIGIWDNFFRLGGHSLKAVQVVARIRKILGVDLPVRIIFEKPTVAELGEEVRKLMSGGEKMRPPSLRARTRSAAASADDIVAQLDELSLADAQSLLRRVLDGKQSA